MAVHGRALSAVEVIVNMHNRLAGAPSGILIGGDGEDLLIAGSTAYDLDSSALGLIQDEWTRTDLDYETRVANLITGDDGRVPSLTVETVSGNGGDNILIGGDGLDMFFATIDLDLTDSEEDESVVVI